MRDKQYFTVDDLDAAHKAGLAFGLTNSSKGRGNTGTRVEEALALMKKSRGGTKVEESKTKDATKLLFELGLSAAAVTAATGGSGSKRGPTADDNSSSNSNSNSSNYSKGKAGTDLPFGLTLDKDGNAAPAIDSKIASLLGMASKIAGASNPLLGIALQAGTTFLTKDLGTKAKDFNKAEEAKFQTMLDSTDKDYSKITGLLGISDNDYSNPSSNSYSPAQDSSAANSYNSYSSDDSDTPNYSNGSTDN